MRWKSVLIGLIVLVGLAMSLFWWTVEHRLTYSMFNEYAVRPTTRQQFERQYPILNLGAIILNGESLWGNEKGDEHKPDETLSSLVSRIQRSFYQSLCVSFAALSLLLYYWQRKGARRRTAVLPLLSILFAIFSASTLTKSLVIEYIRQKSEQTK
jgi:hypothetical protein